MTRSIAAAAGVAALLFSMNAARAECQIVAAAGDAPTESIAQVMSTHGLQNIIDAKGMKGAGPVKTKCTQGTFLVECRSQQKACK
jgi:hypothetical protein